MVTEIWQQHFARNQLVLILKSCLPGVCMREDV